MLELHNKRDEIIIVGDALGDDLYWTSDLPLAALILLDHKHVTTHVHVKSVLFGFERSEGLVGMLDCYANDLPIGQYVPGFRLGQYEKNRHYLRSVIAEKLGQTRG